MEELAKEAAYSMMQEVASFLLEEDRISTDVYDTITNKNLFMQALEAKYKYIQTITEGINHD